MTLVNKVLKGTFWAYASLFSSRLIVFLANAWLVRLLTPQEFGLRHMALIVIGLVEMLQSMGVNEALIFQTEDVEETTDTVFLINLGLGALFSAVTVGFGLWIVPGMSDAGFLATLLGESSLADIKEAMSLLPVLGLSFFILSIGRTHQTLLRKKLDFKTRFWPDIISAVIRSAVAIGFALAGYGVMSLVYSYIVGCMIRSLTNWIVVPWRPRFKYYPEVAKTVWRYGGGLTLFNVVDSVFTKVDEIVIGAGLGSASLGYYGEAQRIPDLLIMNLNVVLTSVIFPAYSEIKEDFEALRVGFITATKYMNMLVLPIALGLWLIAPEFVLIYFGPNWELAIPLLQWLSLTMVWLTMAWNMGDVLKAIGRPGLLTKLVLIEAVVNIPLLIIGASLDARGITGHPALGATIGSSMGFLFGTFIRLITAARLLKLTFREIVGLYWQAFLAGGLMMAGVLLLKGTVASWSSLPVILVSAAAGALIYTGVLLVIARPTLVSAWKVLAEFFRNE
jgi:PST family polysaccharide transporter